MILYSRFFIYNNLLLKYYRSPTSLHSTLEPKLMIEVVREWKIVEKRYFILCIDPFPGNKSWIR